MTGKEAIIHYLGTHNSFCAPDVAALTGATVTCLLYTSDAADE